MSRKEEVEHWYKANAQKIKKYANRRSIQDAEDILQDTAIRLLTEKADWDAILKKDVTRWTMYNYYKDMPVFTEIKDEPIEEEITNTIYVKRCVELINKCVDELNGASKEIFKMRFFQDMDYVEISQKLNMNHMSCKQLGSRAKLIVAEKFKGLLND